MPAVQGEMGAPDALEDHGPQGLIEGLDVQVLVGARRLGNCCFFINLLALPLARGRVDLHAVDADAGRADPLREARLVVDQRDGHAVPVDRVHHEPPVQVGVTGELDVRLA